MYVRTGFIDPSPIVALLYETGMLPLTFGASDGYRILALPADVLDAVRACAAVPGEWRQARLIAIRPSGIIHLHTDQRGDAARTAMRETTRYHIVLETNPHCWNYHAGGMQQMGAGGVYTIDETREHASVNWGETPRVHLVIDTETN